MFEQFIGTKPVEERHRLDVGSLEKFLNFKILQIDQFKGGQSNPTYRITASDEKRYVLRRKPPGKLLPSAHAVEREYKVIKALHAVGFPVAKPHMLCEDEAVIGTAFYGDELNNVISKLHRVNYRAAGLEDFGKPGDYVARQVSRWSKQYQASETQKVEAMDNLIAWLPKNIPAASETSVVHGDFRLDNVVFHPTEPRILAVLDWELSTLGDSLADFSYHCMSWHIPPGQFRGIAGLNLADLGIPSESEYVARYCARSGKKTIEPSDWDYYMAYNLFRMAAILQGIAKRVLEGTAASAHAAEAGSRAPLLAGLGWAQVEKILKRAA